MHPRSIGMIVLAIVALGTLRADLPKRSATLEPGAIDIEALIPKPIKLTVIAESGVYSQSNMQRALGSMAPGTVVQLSAMMENACRVRGRARHGDVAGWMRMSDLKSADPKFFEKLKAFCVRQKTVDELVQKHQIAIGMTGDEVKASLGKPTRKSARVTAAGREETLEFSVYKSVPQIVTGRDQFGNLVQNIVYVKVETGRLTISLASNIVTEIQETQGNDPIPGGAVKIVPAPIVVF